MKFSRIIRVCPFAVAGLVCFPAATHGISYLWGGSSGAQFTNANNWTPVGEPGAADTATFRLGAGPLYPVWLFQGLFDPINRTVDRMIVGTNTVNFAGGVLTIDSTNTTETGRGLIIGQTASDVAVVNSALQGLSTVYATLGSAAGSSGTLNVNAGSFNITGLTPTYDLIVGLFGSGAINVSSGHQVDVSDATVFGLYSGSSGTATVSGAGTTWDNSGGLVYVGYAGSGVIDVTDGGKLTAERVRIANETGSSGDVNVSGANSQLTSTGPHIAVGYRGSGTLDITAGGSVTSAAGYVGYGTSQDGTSSSGVGTALVDGAESIWTNTGNLYVGSFNTTGTLTISNGGRVSNNAGVIAYGGGAADPSVGTVNVTGSTSLWNNSGELYVGASPQSNGTLNITSGGQVNNITGYVGNAGCLCDLNGFTGNVTVDGLNSRWNNTLTLYVGNVGSGTLTVTNGGAVQATDITINSLGEVRGNGTLIGGVQNGGLVAPGTSVGTLDVTGNFTQVAFGVLGIEIGGNDNSDPLNPQFDVLEITGAASLNGLLEVSLIEGFTPVAANLFTILDASSLSGTFANVANGQRLDTVGGEGSFVVSYDGGTGNVVLSAFARAGDYNLDGAVDAADYVAWRKNDNTQPGYNTWRMHFGEPVGSGSGATADATIPELTTLVLVVVAAAGVSSRWRWRTRRMSKLNNA